MITLKKNNGTGTTRKISLKKRGKISLKKNYALEELVQFGNGGVIVGGIRNNATGAIIRQRFSDDTPVGVLKRMDAIGITLPRLLSLRLQTI